MTNDKEFGIFTREQLKELGFADEIVRVSTKAKALAENLKFACGSVKHDDLKAYMIEDINKAIDALSAFEEMAKINKQNILNTF